jgi:hypothetical protein
MSSLPATSSGLATLTAIFQYDAMTMPGKLALVILRSQI